MNNTPAPPTSQPGTTWQVWDCCHLIATFTTRHGAEQVRTDLYDQALHDWPDLSGLLTACLSITRSSPDPDSGPDHDTGP